MVLPNGDHAQVGAANRLELAAVVSEAMRERNIEPQGILGSERTLETLRSYGSGMYRLIRDLRLDSEGQYEDPEEDEAVEDNEPETPEAVAEGGSSTHRPDLLFAP